MKKLSNLPANLFGVNKEFLLENENQQSIESYYSAIIKLKSITEPNNIFDRIQNLIDTTQSIIDCVNNFHISKNLVVGADDLIPIFIYILINSDIKNVYSYLKIMEEFIHSSMEISQGIIIFFNNIIINNFF
jgi:hypothetical protein